MEYTSEQQSDFQERAAAFQKEFVEAVTALKEKHHCEMKYGVVTVPSPSGVFGLGITEQIGDLKFAPKPSPFVPTEDGGVAEAA